MHLTQILAILAKSVSDQKMIETEITAANQDYFDGIWFRRNNII